MRAIAVLLGLLLGALAVEGGARLWLGPAAPERTLFFSEPPWRVWPDGTIRYPPHARLRSVAIYDGHVAYDVSFSTNDAGLVDRRDYLGPARAGTGERIALVGDSFTAGFHAGEPWVPALAARLRAERPDVELYNLGVGATGVLQFCDLALALDERLHFDRVVLLPIGEDFRRPLFRPLRDGDCIHLCRSDRSEDECRSHACEILAMDSVAEPVTRLVERARSARRPPRSLLARTHLGSALLQLVAERREAEAAILPEAARAALAQLSFRFGDRRLLLLRLPEKDEVRRGRVRGDPSAELAALGIESRSLLERCDLGTADFQRDDPHPDARGYARIARCVARELELE